jgi:hypothetical protein
MGRLKGSAQMKSCLQTQSQAKNALSETSRAEKHYLNPMGALLGVLLLTGCITFGEEAELTQAQSLLSTPAVGGPVSLAHCADGSHGMFELDRTGSQHILTGSFQVPGEAQVYLVQAEFSGAQNSDSENSLNLQQLQGQATAKSGSLSESNGGAAKKVLSAFSFNNLDQAQGGVVTLIMGKTQVDLSACRFNIAALKRIRGQEHLAALSRAGI